MTSILHLADIQTPRIGNTTREDEVRSSATSLNMSSHNVYVVAVGI